MPEVKDMKEQLDEAKRGLVDLSAKNKSIFESVEVTPDGEIKGIDGEKQAEFTANLTRMRTLKAFVDDAELQLGVKEWLDRPAGSPVGTAAAAFAQMQGAANAGGFKSIGEQVLDNAAYKAFVESGRPEGQQEWGVDLKIADLGGYAFGKKDIYTALPGTNPYGGFGTVQREQMVDLPMRPGRVRDLYPVQRTSARVIEYFRESGFTNGASVVPERVGSAFGLKPQSTFAFDYHSVVTKTVANWEAAHRNVLADAPQLQDLINTRLLYGLQLHEDYQMLYGTNTGEDLHGIITDPGIQNYSWSAGANAGTNVVADNRADAIRRAITLTTLALFPATGVVVHPSDWEKIELLKGTQGQYLFSTSIAVGGRPTAWNIPIVQSFAITPGTALVGAFGLGAQLYDREEATIRTAEQHADWFPRNAIMILAEERIAQTVSRPSAFVLVTFDHAPT